MDFYQGPIPEIFIDSSRWVDAHGDLANYAFDYFLENSEWPKINNTQRRFDQKEIPEDVLAATKSIPRLSCDHSAFGTPKEVSLPLHALFYLKHKDAKLVLEVVLLIAKCSYGLYKNSDPDQETPLTINIQDHTCFLGTIVNSPDPRFLPLAEKLTSENCPNIFNGGNPGNPFINETIVRELNGVVTIEDYLRKQVELNDKFSPPRATNTPQPSSTKNNSKKIFVIMPFEKDWSDNTYTMIKDLVNPISTIHRADEITKSGQVTDQIVDAIRDASVVIADITGTNPNVMWELGYAHALNKEIVLLNQEINNSPFDVRGLRQVAYSPSPTEQEKNKILEHVKTAIDNDIQRSN